MDVKSYDWIENPNTQSDGNKNPDQRIRKNTNNKDFQFWQQNNEPIELNTNKPLDNTLHYTHYNPVSAGFVHRPEVWIYSSARDYAGEKGPLSIILLDSYLK
jgi:hypothetical protein